MCILRVYMCWQLVYGVRNIQLYGEFCFLLHNECFQSHTRKIHFMAGEKWAWHDMDVTQVTVLGLGAPNNVAPQTKMDNRSFCVAEAEDVTAD